MRFPPLMTRWSTRACFAIALCLASNAYSAGSGQLGILDTSGINPHTGREWAVGDEYRLVFITSESIDPKSNKYGDLDLINNWNAFAQKVASNGKQNLGSVSWYVIGSSLGVSAKDNTKTNPDIDGIGHPIMLIDGSTVVANNYADLWDGELQNTITMTEQMSTVISEGKSGSAWPYTGTRSDGTPMSAREVLRSLSGEREFIRQGQASGTRTWIDREAVTVPAKSNKEIPIYAMSQALSVIVDTAAFGADDNIPEASTALLIGLAGIVLLRRRR